MTFATESDRRASRPGESLPLAFESSAAELAGIRVLPAQFAKLMGVSKQAVTEWKKAGRVTIGIDGRIDPRQAVAQLLRSGDPRRLRSKILAPLMDEVHKRDRRIRELTEALASAQEDADFHEGAAGELLGLFDILRLQVEMSWERIRELPAEVGRAAILSWLDFSMQHGTASGSTILDFALPERSEGEGEGAGF
ncbi:MAG: hypothetical protein JNM32_10110 [Dechloromonas sp.]|nr:hypothetical protein [Dechloromonas sp.]